MTLRPCLTCCELSDRSRCDEHRPHQVKASAAARGYDAAWARLSHKARQLQPFYTDCGAADALRALDADNATPIARVVAVARGRGGVRTVAVACPFCPPTPRGKPRTHIHGWPDDEQQPGVRVAHCDGAARRSYRIELPASAAAS